MNRAHTTLLLQHHRHTGKLLHHRHTSYRGLAVVLGVAGLAIIGLNILAKATADELYVYARIPAPIPTSAASITRPADGAAVDTANQTVSGSCPAITPHVVVTITNNGSPGGSVACDDDNTFTLPITLVAGTNTLVAKINTVTDDAGPDSSPVHITYQPPVSAAPSKPLSTPPVPAEQAPSQEQPAHSAPLSIHANRSYIVYGPSKDAEWTGSFSGGILPYHIKIQWGDGTTNEYTADDSPQIFRHHYRRTHAYSITLQVTDSTGASSVEHFAAVTPYVQPAPIIGNTTGQDGILGALGRKLGGTKLVGFYAAYLSVLAIFGLFWTRSHAFVFAKVPAAKRRKPLVRQPGAGRGGSGHHH